MHSAGATTPFLGSGSVAPGSLARGWPARSGCGAILAHSNHLLSRSCPPSTMYLLPNLGELSPQSHLTHNSRDLRGVQAETVVLRILAAAVVVAAAVAAASPVSPSTPDLPILVASRSRWSAA